MKILFAKKTRKAESAKRENTPVDNRPGVYSDALVWAVSRLNAVKVQPTAGL